MQAKSTALRRRRADRVQFSKPSISQNKDDQEETKSVHSQKSNKSLDENVNDELFDIINYIHMKYNGEIRQYIFDVSRPINEAIVKDTEESYQKLLQKNDQIKQILRLDKILNSGQIDKKKIKLKFKEQIEDEDRRDEYSKVLNDLLGQYTQEKINSIKNDIKYLETGNAKLIWPSLQIDPQEGFEEDLKRKKIIQEQYKQSQMKEAEINLGKSKTKEDPKIAEYKVVYLNQLAKKARGLNWNFFAQQTGITRDQLMQMKELPPNNQEVANTLKMMMQTQKSQAEHRQVVELMMAENSVHRHLLQRAMNGGERESVNFGQVAGGNNGLVQPDNEILNESGQRQQNISNATSVRTQVNNGVIPGILDQSLFSMADAISYRLSNRAKYLGLSHEVVHHLSQLSMRVRQAEARSEPGAKMAEKRMEMQAQNRLTIQSQNAPEVLAQVPNTNGIINYRDQQESDRMLSLNNILFSPDFDGVLNNLSSRIGQTSQQSQLLHQSMAGQPGLMNLIAQSNPDALVRREQQVRNPFEESKGAVHSRSNVAQPISVNSSMQSRASRRLNRSQGNQQASVRYSQIMSNASGSNPYTQRTQSISLAEDDQSFIFGVPSQDESFQNISIINPSFEGVGNPNRSQVAEILNDLNSSLGLHLNSSDILSSDDNLHLPFASSNQDPEGNPFNNWFNQVFRGQNMPVNQSQPMLRNGIVIQKPAITAENFAKFLWQSAKFISEISGPIQDVILKTYQKQTKVYQIPIEKKETTAFKIRPGAAYKIRACE